MIYAPTVIINTFNQDLAGDNMDSKKGNPIALLPIGVFLILYLGLGITFEYILGIEMGFYNVPIVVIFMVSILVACLQNRKVNFDDKISIMAQGVGDKNIILMLLIFIEAGIFVGVVGRGAAQSVAYFMLSLIPGQYAVAVLFVVSCLVSIAMGTSVGTITLITPIGIALSAAAGFSLPLCIASVMGGAMFGDNLSFISDTTIAACKGQGCEMKDKFKENFFIALPAAIVSLIIILAISISQGTSEYEIQPFNLIQTIPYLIVLIGGVIGINVFVVLIMGIVSGIAIMLITGAVDTYTLIGNIGTGAAGMFETAMVAVLVAALCSLIKEYGGFDALLYGLNRVFKGQKGGLLGIGVLVMLMDIATANNTVAIVMANPIAKEISNTYKISPKKTASILDTFSCIAQGIIPYGAQMLVALAAAKQLGYSVSSLSVMACLYYPFLLFVSSIVFIAFGKKVDGKGN